MPRPEIPRSIEKWHTHASSGCNVCCFFSSAFSALTASLTLLALRHQGLLNTVRLWQWLAWCQVSSNLCFDTALRDMKSWVCGVTPSTFKWPTLTDADNLDGVQLSSDCVDGLDLESGAKVSREGESAESKILGDPFWKASLDMVVIDHLYVESISLRRAEWRIGQLSQKLRGCMGRLCQASYPWAVWDVGIILQILCASLFSKNQQPARLLHASHCFAPASIAWDANRLWKLRTFWIISFELFQMLNQEANCSSYHTCWGARGPWHSGWTRKGQHGTTRLTGSFVFFSEPENKSNRIW